MPTVTTYFLRFRGPLHVAERGVGIEETAEFVHSDTLFSALCSVIRLGWGESELQRWLAPFRAGDPPLLLSSAFPFAGSVRFLPKPHLALPTPPPEDARKRLRQTRWVSLGLFRALLDGQVPDDAFAPAAFLPEVAAWLLPSERRALPRSFTRDGQPLWVRDVVPRVAIDRVTNASQVFRSGRLRFGPESGLFVLVDWRDANWRPLLETALAELGQLGLGGLRSTGHGQFTWELAEEIAFPEPATSRGRVTLSLYAPARSELAAGVLGPLARYDLVVRGGWIASPDGASYRRRELRMISEGSVVAPPPGTAVLGQLVDVTPAVMRTVHPVYRYGYAFTVPADLKE